MEEYGQLPVWGWGSQKYSSGHQAVDIGFFSKNNSDAVVAAWSGTVVYQGQACDVIGGKRYYPTVVIMQHEASDATYYTRYWHLASTTCSNGQAIAQGQQIGVRGNTGYSFGKHLHFEVKRVAKGMTYQQTLNQGWNYGNVNPANYIYVFPGQRWENGNDFDLPTKPTIVKPVPVTRDTTKHQVEVLINNLRVRDANNAYYCLCPTGIYNVISQATKTIGGTNYLCNEIESGKWIATDAEWTKDLPIEDKDAIIKRLAAEVADLTTKVTTLTAQEVEKDKKITELTSGLTDVNAKITKVKEILA